MFWNWYTIDFLKKNICIIGITKSDFTKKIINFFLPFAPNDFHSLISGTIRNSSFLSQFLVALKNLPLAFECLCQIPMWYHVHGLVPKKQVTRYFSVLRELPVWQEVSWCTSGLTGSKNTAEFYLFGLYQFDKCRLRPLLISQNQNTSIHQSISQ